MNMSIPQSVIIACKYYLAFLQQCKDSIPNIMEKNMKVYDELIRRQYDGKKENKELIQEQRKLNEQLWNMKLIEEVNEVSRQISEIMDYISTSQKINMKGENNNEYQSIT